MRDIVLMTSDGRIKRSFANLLHRKAKDALKLVFIERRRRKPFAKRVRTLLSKVPPYQFPAELLGFVQCNYLSRYHEAESWLKWNPPYESDLTHVPSWRLRA